MPPANHARRLAKARALVTKLEAQLAESRSAELSGLHEKYGYSSREELIAALNSSGSDGRPRTRGGMKVKTKKKGRAHSAKRGRIDEGTRAKVKDMVIAGRTGAEIAKALAISLPSVQNIKKAFGLTKSRK